MAMHVDQAYCGWSHDDIAHQDESRGVSDSQMLDHGSISFGRFANESLSWERRSVFTHNKCQEELEKFKCPGLVAKKKAYFEEYYKRIRAMKASQENQQTELTLEYGGDESISSQNGEDELAKHTGNLGEEATILVDGHAELVEISGEKKILEVQNRQSEDLEQEDYIKFPLLVEISTEKVKEILEVQNGHLDTKAQSINLGSLRSKSDDIELEDNAKYPLQTQQWDLELDYRSSTRTVEVSEQHGCSDFDMEDVSWKNSVTPIEPEVDLEATKLAKKVVSEKVKNHKAHVSVYKVKEPSAKGRKTSNSEHKTNSDGIMPTRGPKYASQRTTEKSGRVAGSSKTSAVKVPRNIHSFSASPSHRPLTAVRSSVTIPRPFSFSTDRRAAVMSGKREGPVKSDYKASNKTASLAVCKRDAANVQASSKKAIRTTGAQNGVLKNRCHEERKKPLPVDKQPIGLKDRSANMPARPKTRPISIPPHNSHSSSNGTESRIKVHLREDTRKEQKSEATSKVCQTSRKFDTRPAGNLVRETKKISASSTSSHWIKGRKLQSRERSLDGKKPRQEKPRWR